MIEMKRRQINLTFKSKGKDDLLYQWLKNMYAPPAYIKQQLWNIYNMQEQQGANFTASYTIMQSASEKPKKQDRLMRNTKRKISGL